MRLIYIILLSLTISFCSAQDNTNTFEEETFSVVEQMPQFPGGKHALDHYLRDSIYSPISIIQKNIKGKVLVKFIVDKEGNITDVTVIKSLHPMADKVAYHYVKSMPKWDPGRQKGKPVKVVYVLPINFNHYKSSSNKKLFEQGREIEEKVKDVKVIYSK